MLTLQQIKADPARTIERLAIKGFDGKEPIAKVLQLDEQRRTLQLENDNLAAELNRAAASIGALMKQGKREEAEQAKATVASLKERQKGVAQQLAETEMDLHTLLTTIPNLPCDMVPAGTSAADNVVEKTGGPMPDLGDDALPHWDLCKKYNLIDFDLGVKITGAGFPVYIGKGARLQRALIQFFLDQANEAGYVEIEPPYVVNEASAYGTGQLPDKEGQMYHDAADDYYMIPTAEVPVTNFYRDEVFEESQLPVCACAYTPCFRREAGSWGKDVRGLNRLHQFDKVELVKWAHPDRSFEELEKLRNDAEGILQKLNLPYRVLSICTGDIGFPHAKQFDLEVWAAGQKRWLEVSSCSCFTDFQARRANIRFKSAGGKPAFVHTLNGSGLAIPRVLAALLENNVRGDGSIAVPEALAHWYGSDTLGA